MKTLTILSITALLTMAVIHSEAQVKEQIKETKKEIKADRKALRKLEGTSVSDLAKTNFVSTFGNIPNVVWKRVDTYDEASFTKDGKKMKAFYDENADLVGTISSKKFTDLPANAQKEIKTKYKDYSIGPVRFFDDNEWNETDMILYGTQFDDADNYFVELIKANNKTLLKIDTSGDVSLFKTI